MRRVFVLLGLIISLSVSAQTKLTKGGSFELLDRQGDTLIASDTLDYTIKLGNDIYGIMSLAVESDSVSGVAAYDCFLHKSLNGIDWGSPIDTVSFSGGGDAYLEFGAVNATSTYYLLRFISTAAAQNSNVKGWGRLNEGFVLQE